jgi:hypothetical protein
MAKFGDLFSDVEEVDPFSRLGLSMLLNTLLAL